MVRLTRLILALAATLALSGCGAAVAVVSTTADVATTVVSTTVDVITAPLP